ncbi:hypothetical protein PM082_022879 [Marasmius tenuissimus]|nr:hypothetical protein PM082_022879 [Marasmius tenuissimus]
MKSSSFDTTVLAPEHSNLHNKSNSSPPKDSSTNHKPPPYIFPWPQDKNNGVQDQIEPYNITFSVNRDVHRHDHPEASFSYLDELQRVAHYNHYNILVPILELLALGLELPADTLAAEHNFNSLGESSGKSILDLMRGREDQAEKTKQVWLKGHKDIGLITFLWPQQVTNAGHAIEFLCGDYYPGTRHRVIRPPKDQRNCSRLGAFYFAMANDDVKSKPHAESPVLAKAGIKEFCEPEDAPTMKQWRTGVTAAYGRSNLTAGQEQEVEEEMIHGVLVKHFN